MYHVSVYATLFVVILYHVSVCTIHLVILNIFCKLVETFQWPLTVMSSCMMYWFCNFICIVDVVHCLNTIEMITVPVKFQDCFVFYLLSDLVYIQNASTYFRSRTQNASTYSFVADRFNIVNQNMVYLFLPIFRRFLMIYNNNILLIQSWSHRGQLHKYNNYD